MRAVIHERYGRPEVLRVHEVERPVPAENEVLVKVHATTVNRTDTAMRAAHPWPWRFMIGLRRPKQKAFGRDLAGEVEAVGAAVTKFAVGDRVFGMRTGANAEYVCVREAGILAHMPEGVSFEQAAAAADGAQQALETLRRANVGAGTRLLVYGASGSLGTAAVQIAKSRGAHVTGVTNTRNVELVRSLGADEIVDYLQEDFWKRDETYDVILDAVGKLPFRKCRRSLKPGGLFVATDLGLRAENPFWALWTWKIGDRQVVFPIVKPSQDGVLAVKQLIEAGHFEPVIDRTYPLEQIAEAHRYVDTQQKTGNVVLTVNGNTAEGGSDAH